MLPEVSIRQSFLSGILVSEAVIDTTLEDDLRCSAIKSLHSLQATTWNRLRIATVSDDDMNLLLSVIEACIPAESCLLPPQLRKYQPFRDHLYAVDA